MHSANITVQAGFEALGFTTAPAIRQTEPDFIFSQGLEGARSGNGHGPATSERCVVMELHLGESSKGGRGGGWGGVKTLCKDA
jgi:hypothetical protein